MDYPVDMEYIKDPYKGLVVRFTSEKSGEIITPCTGYTSWRDNYVGYWSDKWNSCTNSTYWKPCKPIIINFLDDSLFQIDV